jgi:hypothetical protein
VVLVTAYSPNDIEIPLGRLLSGMLGGHNGEDTSLCNNKLIAFSSKRRYISHLF